MRRAMKLMLLLAGCAALAACSKPKVPDHDDRPEPQAAAAPTQLREAMQKPIDKAEAAQAKTAAAEKARDDALNAATGQ